MSLLVVDYGAAETASLSGTTLTVAWHSGSAPADNTLLLAVTSGSGSNAATPPSGWNTAYNQGAVAGNSNVPTGLFWKEASSEPTSYAFTFGTGLHFNVMLMSISGAANGLPQWVQSTNGSNPTTATTGSITPYVTNELAIEAFCGSGGVTAIATPASSTLETSINDASGYLSIFTYHTALLGTGSFSTSTTVTGSGSWAVNTFLIVVAPSTVFLEPLSASLNVSAPGAYITGRAFTGALAFVGSLGIAVAKKFTASINVSAPGGAISGRGFTAALTLAATLKTAFARTFTATVTPAASIVRSRLKTLSGIAFTSGTPPTTTYGSVMLLFGSVFAQPPIPPKVGLVRSTILRPIAALQFAVTNFLTNLIINSFPMAFTAATNVSGNVSRRISRALSGLSALTGAISSIATFVQALSGSTGVSGTFARAVIIQLNAILELFGSASKSLERSLTGTSALIATITRNATLGLSASTSLASGAITKAISRAVSAVTGLTAATSTVVIKVLLGATTAITASLAPAFTVMLTAATQLAGSNVVVTLSRALTTAATATTAVLTRSTQLVYTAVVAQSATIGRSITDALSASASIVGSTLGALHLHFQSFAASTGLVGARVVKAIGLPLIAVSETIASLLAAANGVASIAFTATTSLIGSVNRRTSSFLVTGFINPVGSIAKSLGRTLAAAVGVIGSVIYTHINSGMAVLTASLSPIGTTSKTLYRSLAAATIEALGVQTKALQKTFSASVATGAVISRVISRAYGALLNVTGNVGKQFARQITAAVVSVSGALNKQLSRAFIATSLSAAGIARTISLPLAASGNMMSGLTRSITAIFAAAIAPLVTGLSKRIVSLTAAAVNVGAAVSRATTALLAGTTTTLGTLANTGLVYLFASFTASLGLAGNVAKAITRNANAATNVAGTISRQIVLPLVAAANTVFVAGQILTYAIHVYQLTFAAKLLTAATVNKAIDRGLTASLATAGNFVWGISF